MGVSDLRDCRILVVEDEYAIAVSLRDALETVGATVIGPWPTVERAIKAIELAVRIDAAVVDINLGGVMAFPVADLLSARKIPFVFTSRYENDFIRSRYPRATNCQKPYLFATLAAALKRAMSERRR